jgi:hypothetical protein
LAAKKSGTEMAKSNIEKIEYKPVYFEKKKKVR